MLTRNRRDLIEVTLSAAGNLEFDPDVLLGRECATPKPSPDGVLNLQQLGNRTRKSIMVGDHQDDAESGIRAGCLTVHILKRKRACASKHNCLHRSSTAHPIHSLESQMQIFFLLTVACKSVQKETPNITLEPIDVRFPVDDCESNKVRLC